MIKNNYKPRARRIGHDQEEPKTRRKKSYQPRVRGVAN